MQAIFIGYLVIACQFKIFFNLGDNPIFTVCNSIIFTLKGVLLVWKCRRFVVERSMLFRIEYEDFTLCWKYTSMMSRVLVLICYGLLFLSDSFYPVTLLL